jgi:hypothetical protein
MNWLTLIFCFVIGSAALFYGFKFIRLYKTVRKWNKVPARILHKAIVPRKLAAASRARFALSIEYSYRMDQKEYTNHMVFLVELIKGERAFYKKDVEKFLNCLNNEMEVFVDPEDPKRSVMFCDGIILYLFVVIIGCFAILAGLVGLLA